MRACRPSTVALRRYIGRVFDEIPEADTSVSFFDLDAERAMRALPAYMLRICDHPDESESVADEIALRVAEHGPPIAMHLLNDWQLVALREIIDTSLDMYASRLNTEVNRDAFAAIGEKLNGFAPLYQPVLDEIERAFAETPRPDDELYAMYKNGFDEDTFCFYKGTRWSGHDGRELGKNYAAASFFTDEAFRYWSPAFMIAGLEQSDEVGMAVGGFLSAFSQRHRPMGIYTETELLAIVQYFEYCHRRDERPDAHGHVWGTENQDAADAINEFREAQRTPKTTS